MLFCQRRDLPSSLALTGQYERITNAPNREWRSSLASSDFNEWLALSRMAVQNLLRRAERVEGRLHERPTDSVGNNPRFVGVRYVVEPFFSGFAY